MHLWSRFRSGTTRRRRFGDANSARPTWRRDNSTQCQLDAGESARGHFGAASHAVQGQLPSGHEKGSSTTACYGTSAATYARKTPGSNNTTRFGLPPTRIPSGAFRTVPDGGTSRTGQRDTVRPEPELEFIGTVQKVVGLYRRDLPYCPETVLSSISVTN